MDVLISPWCEKPGPILAWAEEEMRMDNQELQTLVEEAVVQSLTTNCKVERNKSISILNYWSRN